MSHKKQKKQKQPEKPVVAPEEFAKIINDFTTDILITFPEYSGIISRWWNKEANTQKEIDFVFNHCIKVFPERFFDILYKNADIFNQDSTLDTEFLPGVVFKYLWSLDISEKTRETIWKYLQLILFSVIGTIHNSSELGETAKLFEAIDEEELKKKLEETLEGMQNIFDNNFNNSTENTNTSNANVPNAEDLHNHITSLMNGKLGKLAMELAEETAKDLNIDMENTTNAKDIFQKLFKNPTKMMNMIKTIGSRLDEKMKSGEIKESELMEEGMELLKNMKNMPGMDNMQQMFSQMGLGKGAKLNMAAMEAQMNRNIKQSKLKERLREKVGTKKTVEHNTNTNEPLISEEEIIKIFSTGEKVQKTPRPRKNKK
jgi:hypothetical protein